MARYSSVHPEVRALIDDFLVPGFLATGSIASLTRAVVGLIGDGMGTQPHANRINALLADDPAKGVNEGTVALLREAARKNPWRADPSVSAALSEIGELAMPHAASGLDHVSIAGLLSVPPAIVRKALPARSPSVAAPPPRGAPDWSFQDVAVERCVDAIRRRPTGNIGLVLPTGAGKTRVALRIILERLSAAPAGARAVWITHRHLLREQALRELANLIERPPPGLPADAMWLADRIDFALISEIPALLDAPTEVPALVVVDEAHHAAAPTYQPIFDGKTYPVLLLTATPIRPDAKPIFIDEIAYTVTYRQLAELNAIVIPTFEPLGVESLEMTPDTISKLAQRVAIETRGRFRKTLVVTSRIEHVDELHAAIRKAVASIPGHPVALDDVGFIHGEGNSHRLGDEAFLALFAEKRRAILISAQMLLEGFDDPAIDSVVITYRTESVIKLMQAAGRCVRRSPGKTDAWVVQVDNPTLAYRFDQRWLYQEISDRVRPELEDHEYGSQAELLDFVAGQLARHNVSKIDATRALDVVAGLGPEDQPRLMFYGLPYFGRTSDFTSTAEWGVFVETRKNSAVFREAFNRYSETGVEPADPTEFMTAIRQSLGLMDGGSRLERDLVKLLTATYFARRETAEAGGGAQRGRGYQPHGATTWLRYVVTRLVPDVPPAFTAFLADCHNKMDIAAEYLDEPTQYTRAFKIPLPVGGFEAGLLDASADRALSDWLDAQLNILRAVDPASQLSRIGPLVAELPPPPIPPIYLSRMEALISTNGRRRHTLNLTDLLEKPDA